MTRPVRLDLDPERVTLAAGDTARLSLTLRNTSDEVQHLHVEVRGLPEGALARTEPATVKLMPAATGVCALAIELPASAPAQAGAYVLGVLARSPHRTEVSRCEEVHLEVPAAPGLAMSVEPELVRSGTRAGFVATLVNSGNAPLHVALEGSDPERHVRLRFTPRDVDLQPRQRARVAVWAQAPRAWTGQDHRRPLTLVASAQDLTATQTVTLVQPPRLPPLAVRVLAGLVTVLVLAGVAVLTGLVPGTDDPVAGRPTADGQSSEEPLPGETPTEPQVQAQPTPDQAPTSPTPSEDVESPTPESTAPSPPPSDPPSTEPPDPPSSAKRTVPLAADVAAAAYVDEGAWVAEGFRIAPDLALARDGCRTADRLVAHPGEPWGFVTAATAEDMSACNDVPLTVTFLDPVVPVEDVIVELVDPGPYVLRGTDVAGDALQRSDPAGAGLAKALEREQLQTVAVGSDEGGPARVGITRLVLTPTASAED